MANSIKPDQLLDEYNNSFFFIKWFYPSYAYQHLKYVYGDELSGQQQAFSHLLPLIAQSLYFFQRWFFPKLNQFIKDPSLAYYNQLVEQPKEAFETIFNYSSDLSHTANLVSRAEQSRCTAMLLAHFRSQNGDPVRISEAMVSLIENGFADIDYFQGLLNHLMKFELNRQDKVIEFYQLLLASRQLERSDLREMILSISEFASWDIEKLNYFVNQLSQYNLSLLKLALVDSNSFEAKYLAFKNIEAFKTVGLSHLILHMEKDHREFSQNLVVLHESGKLTQAVEKCISQHNNAFLFAQLINRCAAKFPEQTDETYIQELGVLDQKALKAFIQLANVNGVTFEDFNEFLLNNNFKRLLVELCEGTTPKKSTLIYLKEIGQAFIECVKGSRQEQKIVSLMDHFENTLAMTYSDRVQLVSIYKTMPSLATYSKEHIELCRRNIIKLSSDPVTTIEPQKIYVLCALLKNNLLTSENAKNYLELLKDNEILNFILENKDQYSSLFFEYALSGETQLQQGFKEKLSNCHEPKKMMRFLDYIKTAKYLDNDNILNLMRLFNEYPQVADNVVNLETLFALKVISPNINSGYETIYLMTRIVSKSMPYNTEELIAMRDLLEDQPQLRHILKQHKLDSKVWFKYALHDDPNIRVRFLSAMEKTKFSNNVIKALDSVNERGEVSTRNIIALLEAFYSKPELQASTKLISELYLHNYITHEETPNGEVLSEMVSLLDKKLLINDNSSKLMKAIDKDQESFHKLYRFLERKLLLNKHNLVESVDHMHLLVQCIDKIGYLMVYIDQSKWTQVLRLCEQAKYRSEYVVVNEIVDLLTTREIEHHSEHHHGSSYHKVQHSTGHSSSTDHIHVQTERNHRTERVHVQSSRDGHSRRIQIQPKQAIGSDTVHINSEHHNTTSLHLK